MSHSVVKDFPTQTVDNTLILVVNKNGELSVDKETLDGYAKLGNSQVSILRVDNDDGSTVDMTLDTFHPTDTMDELTISVEDELIRNYNSFRMDHCYTPLTSPSQQKPVIPTDHIDDDLELDDLAHTLSILDGSNSSPPAPTPPTTTTTSTTVNKVSPPTQNVDNKVSFLNKVNKLGVKQVYKSVKQVLKGAKVIKKPEIITTSATTTTTTTTSTTPAIIEAVVAESESDDDDDDNDSDFEIDESPIKKQSRRPVGKRHDPRNKSKIRKSKSKKQPEPLKQPEPIIQTAEILKSPAHAPQAHAKQPKKEKKPPKPFDDGIALFSTPDIIKRVGKSGEKLPDGAATVVDSPPKIKPAKIEDRSKSDATNRHSTETKQKRHSLDSKVRRMSNISDKSEQQDESFDSIAEAVGNLESVIGVATPTTEMIRSIIHTDESPAAAHAPTAAPIVPDVNAAVVNNSVEPTLNLVDNAALDQIDQNILDNINAEELIPEDILYQVAKLVENPDVQNVIDRTLVDANLIQTPSLITETPTVTNQNVLQQTPVTPQQPPPPPPPAKNTPKPIQIVRSDGRVVTLPPIEKPATRSSKKKQETLVSQATATAPAQLPPSQQLQQQQLVAVTVAPQPHPPQSPQVPVAVASSPSVTALQHAQMPIAQVILHPLSPQHMPKAQSTPKIQKPLALPLADEFIVEDAAATVGEGDTDSDESWNSEDDPDRLWCICKQPHNNRFMICCDTCEDWFHGKCVNVTKAMGQQMEAQGKEWQCPNCIKKINTTVSSTSSTNPNPSNPAKVARVPPASVSKRKSTESGGSGPSCIVCSSSARANSVYCSDACILKHAQGVEKETNKIQKSTNAPQRIIVFERSTGKCLSGPNAPTANNLKQWLKEHPGFEVVRPINKTKQQNQNLVQSKLQLVKNPHGKEGVGLAVNRKGVQLGVLPTKQQNTIKLIPPTKMVPGSKTTPTSKQTTQQSPNKKLIQTTLKPSTPSTTATTNNTPSTPSSDQTKQKQLTPNSASKAAKIRERKQKLQTPETTPRQNAQENIRETVKKTLLEQLLTRLKEVEDIKLAEEEVDKMATEIETQLYKLFGDSGPKYRAKYRSLIFNIKDPKNQTLWRRICEKSISPHQLVRLSPEEMASQELARWREQENKHQLDMIKKSELEMLSINRKYVLKTHKGEQVMEDRPSVIKVDSTEIMPGLGGADSTSEQDTTMEKEKSDHNSDHSSERRSKHSRRDRDRDRDKRSSKDSNSKERSKSRKRSRSRDRDRDKSSNKERKRSRSRERHHRSSHKSSRHKRDKHGTEHLDKKSREILDNLENNKIVPPPEDRLWKHVPQQDIQEITPDSDSDHEPTSTVTIPTPPRSTEQEDTNKKEDPISTPTPIPTPTPTPTVVIPIVPKPKEPSAPRSSDPRINREAAVVETPPESEVQTPSVSNSPSPATIPDTAIWEGHINMADVAKFFISLHEVSGDCIGLDSELTSTLDIVGRITPDTVWDYIGKMKRSNSKLISVLRLTAGNIEEQMQYIALFTYLSNRKRFGVIKTPNSAIKDFYIMPLASHAPIPVALMPLSGPGFKENRPDLLLGILVRAKRKRPNPIDIVTSGSSAKRSRLEDSPNINQTSSSISSTPAAIVQPPRSYTPPPTRDPRIRLPTIPAVAATLPNDDDEPYSPEDSDPESIPVILQKTPKPSVASVVSVAAAATTINIKAADNKFIETTASVVASFEPFSNKFDGIPGLDEAPTTNAALIQKQLEELNKCIEQQKDEIQSISQNLASTASSSSSTSVTSNLSNINLPSNLQQILDSIKNIPSTTSTSQDMEEYCPSAPGYKTAPNESDDLTIPLMLPKLSSRTQSSSRVETTPSGGTIPLKLTVPPVRVEPTPTPEILSLPNMSVPPPTHLPPPPIINTTIPLNLPTKAPTKIVKPLSPPPIAPPGTSPVIIPVDTSKSVLSSLSEEELIRKAAEMLGESEEREEEKEDSPEPESESVKGKKYGAPPVMYCAGVTTTTTPTTTTTVVAPPPPLKRTKIDRDPSQPPVPGLEDEFDDET